jgi:hypothetical protein
MKSAQRPRLLSSLLGGNESLCFTIDARLPLRVWFVDGARPKLHRHSKRPGLVAVSVEADDIRGSYQNLDVDCVVFSYSTRVQSAGAFWQKLTASLQGTSWKEIKPMDAIRRFERRFPKGKGKSERTDMAIFSSAEETRVSYKQGRAVVAWVQADSSKDEASFAETSEAAFADRVVWPKFQALIK